MSTPALPAPGTVPQIPAEPLNGVQPWQRPSKPLLPIWPPWEERMRLPEVLPSTTKHRGAPGLVDFELLAEAVWPNRGPEVTFAQLLDRARTLRFVWETAHLKDSALDQIT